MKKQRLRTLAAVLFCALIASACSGGGGSTATNTNEGGSGGGDGKTVTLKFMGWEASPLETESVKKGLDKFMKEHPNIKVEYQPVPGAQYSQKLLTMLAGNAAPDVFFLGATDYRSFQERDVLLDLTPMFETEMSIDDFIPSSATIMSIDGKIYGVSSCTVSPVLYYNKDIFDKANLPYPPSDPAKAWTWSEFRDAAKKLTVTEGGKVTQYGFFGLESFYMTGAMLFSNGAELFNEDGTQMRVNSPQAKEVLQAVLDLRLKDGASPTAKTLESIGMSPAQMLQTGKVAMMVDGSWALQELAAMKFPVGVASLPKFQEAKTHGQAHVHSAWAKTKHPKEAWELVKFLSSEEYQIDLISAGLWMPNRKSLYTEEGIAKWYNDKVHPEGFKELIPFFRDAEPYPFALIRHNKVNSIITEETDKLWYSGQSADDTVKNIETRANEELAK
ncbi:ABC transporter substrate-binding protein [Paenibacillus alkalitolerans]|uniref:ABC transporter substrate-binding protein n=1 Tax=Paenibacillus alkalitolerans TaxID=2799335 RepID=UPI0018F3A4FA|nr:sugar ABC transporter substrate-binding protein [Paenibacillus alkalitolerans]